MNEAQMSLRGPIRNKVERTHLEPHSRVLGHGPPLTM